jgi:ferredoxin-thioredoxin reductase catalytic chain
MSMRLATQFFIVAVFLGYSAGIITFYYGYFKQDKIKAFISSIKSHLKSFQDWLEIHWKYLKKRFVDVIHMMLLRSKEIIVPIIAHINGEDMPITETTEEESLPWYQRYAKSAGVVINPNTEIRDTVLEGLEHNKTKYGARYCPCMNPSYYGQGKQSSDLVCPCYKMRHNKICHCGLFLTEVPLDVKYPDLAGQTINSVNHPGMKYQFGDDGSVKLVNLDGTEGPVTPTESVTEEVKTQ